MNTFKAHLEISDFNHSIKLRVRTFEVDSQGIVHNMNYLKYFEIGRIEYRRNLGYRILPSGIFNDGLKVVVVHNEIDYILPSYLDDELSVFTRIPWIKNSSFCFEHLIMNQDGKRICTGKGILVNLNTDNTPLKLESKFVDEIKLFEKNLLLI